MSYQISIKVRKVNGPLDAINTMVKFKDNFNYLDFFKEFKEILIFNYMQYFELEKFKGFSKQADYFENYLQNLFILQFVYWPKYNMLGLIERNYDTAEYRKFSPDVLSFQNSTDQDYPKETWDSLSDEAKEGMPELPDTYDGRTDLYQWVYDRLHLDDLFDGRNNDDIMLISMGDFLQSLPCTVYFNLKKEINEAFKEYIARRR